MKKIRFSHKTASGKTDPYTYSIIYQPTQDDILFKLIDSRIYVDAYTQDILEILKEIDLARKEYVLRSIPALLTNTQLAVFGLLFTKNQTQIAQELGIAQSTVHRIIYGVPRYTSENKKPKIKYGGLIKKIQKWLIVDAVLQQLATIEADVAEQLITADNAYRRLILLGLV